MNEERIFQVLVGPHASEKAAIVADSSNQYVFRVAANASKLEIKRSIEKTYGRRGEAVVQRNWAAVDRALAALHDVPIPPAATATAARRQPVPDDAPAFVRQVTAPLIDGPIDGALILRNTWPFNAARTPTISVPYSPAPRLPIGIQLTARRGQDERLLEVARVVERA